MCKEIAKEYENRQRDQGYTQEQIREKLKNKTNKSCHICQKEIAYHFFICITTIWLAIYVDLLMQHVIKTLEFPSISLW